MKILLRVCLILAIVLGLCMGCRSKSKPDTANGQEQGITAKFILGKPDYQAISYGGYRQKTREVQPSLDELKEDLKILSAMDIKVLRTYNVHLPHASNILEAIAQLKQEDANFEMYVMLGAWIDCKDAWTANPDHDQESERNEIEIATTVQLAKKYPDIVKIIAVGNEAMIKWAESYYVQPKVILKWVNHLQKLKQKGDLPKTLWITSSDNFEAWGGGSAQYHIQDLTDLIKAVDYVSMHTYPMHDTHYNPIFWGVALDEESMTKAQKIENSMLRAKEHAVSQYKAVKNFLQGLGIEKPIHIGETGWATFSNGLYGSDGSKATDEYKEALYYDHMREWTNKENISCFYFEAFDEVWKDAKNQGGSENHFGLFTIDGKAKYALWDFVDQGVFEGLTRNGNPITKTYNGDLNMLLKQVVEPDTKPELTQKK